VTPARIARAAALAVVAVPAGSCAFARGEAFGTLDATVSARVASSADRDAGEGFTKLASDWQIRFVELELTVDALVLSATDDADAGGEAFDPAHPPPGYSLCHGGHCHADDGRLVPYEEVAAEIGGGSTSVALAAPVGALDLVEETRRAIDCGDCALPEGRIERVALLATELRVALEVRDGRAEPRWEGSRTAHASVDLRGAPEGSDRAFGELSSVVDLPIGDDEPPEVELSAEVAPTAAIFDAVAFEDLGADGVLGAEAEARIASAFAEVPLRIRAVRREEREDDAPE
jgi:hypothetical protein